MMTKFSHRNLLKLVCFKVDYNLPFYYIISTMEIKNAKN